MLQVQLTAVHVLEDLAAPLGDHQTVKNDRIPMNFFSIHD